MINHRQRSDVILYEPGDRFVHGRFRVNRDDPIPFGVQDIANQHGAPSPGETRRNSSLTTACTTLWN